jgi:hypothetical protein
MMALQSESSNKTVYRDKIFIVHGHDNKPKLELARYLENTWGLNPIILHEQANQGKTLIEKLETNANVGYAFIILTPDDVGRENKAKLKLRARARQNVIFEFGFFIGLIHRNRVCCLYKSNTKLPSDLDGIVYVPFTRSVKECFHDIDKELDAAGYKQKDYQNPEPNKIIRRTGDTYVHTSAVQQFVDEAQTRATGLHVAKGWLRDFSRDYRSLKKAEKGNTPITFGKALEKVEQELHFLSRNDPITFPWNKSIRRNLDRVIVFIDNRVSDSQILIESRLRYVKWIAILITKNDPSFQDKLKRRFSPKIDHLYMGDESFVLNADVFFLYQHFHEYDEFFMKNLVQDAIFHWKPEKFAAFQDRIDFPGLKRNNPQAISRMRTYLGTVMFEREQAGKEEQRKRAEILEQKVSQLDS